MKSVNEQLVLFMRQAQLERAMKQRDSARIVEEQEHYVVRQNLGAFPGTVNSDAVVQDNDRV